MSLSVESALLDLVRKKSRLHPEKQLTYDMSLKDVLSSMAMLELILEIEEMFEIEFPLSPEVLDKLQTIGLAIKTVDALIQEKNASSG